MPWLKTLEIEPISKGVRSSRGSGSPKGLVRVEPPAKIICPTPPPISGATRPMAMATFAPESARVRAQ